MNKTFVALLYFLAFAVFSSSAVAAPPEDIAAASLTAGSRTDNLDWNIAGNTSGTNPNILSELQWNDIGIYQVKASGKAVFDDENIKGNGFYLRGFMDYGWIHSGTNQDSDYSGDNRTGEFSRSNNNADTGSVYDVSLGMGYKTRFVFKNSVLDISPLGGYSQHRLNLTITNGYQTIPSSGAFAGLNSTYKATWSGPWLGIDLDLLRKNIGLHSGIEYHIANYKAVANWNLRSDFNHPKSFEHFASGTGFVAFLGGDYTVWEKWAITADANYQKWTASNGTDRTYFANGATSDTRLNKVHWTSYAYMLGFKRRF